MRRSVGVLISGRGSNMAALVDAARDASCPFEIAIVASDRGDAPGLAWAKAQGVPVFTAPPGKAEREAAIDREFRAAGVEMIALAGYMRLLSAGFVAAWHGRIVNIHPSLLPAYKGLDTHARELAAGDIEAGCSVHVVTEELDGGAVLAQARVPILAGDTPDSLAERVLAEEHRLYPQALAEYVTR